MSEVYCKDCENFVKSRWTVPGDYCIAPELGIVKDYIYGDFKRTVEVGHEDYPNKRDTNGCQWFKAKVIVPPKPYVDPYEKMEVRTEEPETKSKLKQIWDIIVSHK